MSMFVVVVVGKQFVSMFKSSSQMYVPRSYEALANAMISEVN
jgi:hypothetical protein